MGKTKKFIFYSLISYVHLVNLPMKVVVANGSYVSKSKMVKMKMKMILSIQSQFVVLDMQIQLYFLHWIYQLYIFMHNLTLDISPAPNPSIAS